MSTPVLWLYVALLLFVPPLGGGLLKLICWLLGVPVTFLRSWMAYLASYIAAVIVAGTLVVLLKGQANPLVFVVILAIQWATVPLELNRWRPRVRVAHTIVFLLCMTVTVAASSLFYVIGTAGPASRRAVMRMEIKQLETALEYYRAQLGNYPPDFTNPATVRRHVQIAFPRYTGDLPPQCAELDPASALTFWLGGMTDADGRFIGFSANPADPFNATDSSRLGPFFEFDPQRVKKVGVGFWYLPPNGNTESEPYLYFKEYARPGVSDKDAGNWKDVRPYKDARTGAYANPGSCQILCPGSDGRYGRAAQSAAGKDAAGKADYDPYQEDDLGNFPTTTDP